MLNETIVKRAKAKDKPYKLYDEGGLYLQVMPGRRKVWRLRYHWDGKEQRIKIGEYPDVSVNDARMECAKVKKWIADGVRPSFAMDVGQRKSKALRTGTFQEMAEEWHASMVDRWTDRHAGNVLDSLKKWVFPHIGTYPMAKIDAPTVMTVLARIQDVAAIETCHRVRQRISAVFVYGIAMGCTPVKYAFCPAAHPSRGGINSDRVSTSKPRATGCGRT